MFIDFNKCKGCNYTCYIKKSEDKNRIVWGIVAGTSIVGRNDNPNVIVFNPIIGVNLSVYSRRNRGSRSLFLEVLYEKGISRLQTFGYSSTQDDFYLNATYRRHILLKNEIHPFYGLGLNIRYTTSQTITSSYGSYLLDSGGINNQILGEIGFEYKKIQFNLRAKYQIIENQRLSFQTTVTYQFK